MLLQRPDQLILVTMTSVITPGDNEFLSEFLSVGPSPCNAGS